MKKTAITLMAAGVLLAILAGCAGLGPELPPEPEAAAPPPEPAPEPDQGPEPEPEPEPQIVREPHDVTGPFMKIVEGGLSLDEISRLLDAEAAVEEYYELVLAAWWLDEAVDAQLHAVFCADTGGLLRLALIGVRCFLLDEGLELDSDKLGEIRERGRAGEDVFYEDFLEAAGQARGAPTEWDGFLGGFISMYEWHSPGYSLAIMIGEEGVVHNFLAIAVQDEQAR